MTLLETVVSHVESENRQHTPKPDAQFPDAVPDLAEHSDKARHTPSVWVLELVSHTSFGN